MKQISVIEVTKNIKEMCIEANHFLSEDMKIALNLMDWIFWTSYLKCLHFTICEIKLNDNLLSILILSCLCGVLMYIAVNNYKKHNTSIGKYMGIFMCVMVFILSGFEHSVANMFYFSVAGLLSWNTVLYILVMVIGNSIGAILIALYDNKINRI